MDADVRCDRTGVLVVPNYHVWAGDHADGSVRQKPNEVEFYRELACKRCIVGLAAALVRETPDPRFDNLDPTTSEIVSLGIWRADMGIFAKLFFYARSTWILANTIGRFEVIYVYLPGTNSLIASALSILFRKKFGVYLRGGIRKWGAGIEFIFQYVLSKASFVLCTGKALEQYSREYCSMVSQVSPMIPFSPYDRSPVRRLDKDTPLRILYVGAFAAEKGIYDVIRVCAEVKRVGGSVTLTMIGDGPPDTTRSLLAVAEAEGICSETTISGFVSDRESLRKAYEDAHVFLFPSTYNEGFPRVLYEAMLLGCAIFAYELDVYSGFLSDNKNCRLFEPGSIELMARAILEVTESQSRYLDLCRAGQDCVIEHLSEIGNVRHGEQVASCISRISK